MKKHHNNPIIASTFEFDWSDLDKGIVRYKGQPVIDTNETEKGWLEMHYCDENGNLIPNTPTVIMRTERRE